MNQRHLSYFLTVENCRSIKTAASILNISSQGLSKTIISLEHEMGNKLFTRTKDGLIPTAYAKKLKPYAIQVLKAYDNLNNNMVYPSNKNNIFNVVTTYGVICILGVDFVRKFYENNPNTQLNLVEMTDYPAIEKLENNEVELAILPAPLDTTRFMGEKILESKHCLIINDENPLCQKDLIDYKDLDNQPIVLKGREYAMYNNNINRFLSEGASPTIYMETTDDKMIADLAQQNIAIGVSLDYIALADQRSGTKIKYFADSTCTRTLYLAQAINTGLSKTALSFKELITEHFQHIRDKTEQ